MLLGTSTPTSNSAERQWLRLLARGRNIGEPSRLTLVDERKGACEHIGCRHILVRVEGERYRPVQGDPSPGWHRTAVSAGEGRVYEIGCIGRLHLRVDVQVLGSTPSGY